MNWDWFWQWPLEKVLQWALPFLGAFLMGWWRERDGKWTAPVLFGLVTFTCIFFVISEVQRARRVQSVTGLQDTTPSIVEATIKPWIEESGYAVRKGQDTNPHFKLIVNFQSGRDVAVTQPKTQSIDSLVFATNVIVSKDQLDRIEKLSAEKQRWLLAELSLELVKLELAFSAQSPPLKVIYLRNQVPILGLERQDFQRKLASVDRGIIVVAETINVFLANHKP